MQYCNKKLLWYINILWYITHVTHENKDKVSPFYTWYTWDFILKIRLAGTDDLPSFIWPPRDPDLAPCDFFFCVNIKYVVYTLPLPKTLKEVNGALRTAKDVQSMWNKLGHILDFVRNYKLQITFCGKGGYICNQEKIFSLFSYMTYYKCNYFLNIKSGHFFYANLVFLILFYSFNHCIMFLEYIYRTSQKLIFRF